MEDRTSGLFAVQLAFAQGMPMNGMGMMTMGADGTVYIVRLRPLAARRRRGRTLEIPGLMMSKPAVAPDGRLFLTSGSIAFDHQGIQGGMMGLAKQ